MIKTTLRLPTDEYAYIEIEVEVESPKEAANAYFELKEAYFKANAMPQIEYNTIYDLVRAKQPIVGDPGMQMSTAQKFALNELKKSNARNANRLKSKPKKDTSYEGQEITTHEDQL